MNLEVEYIHVLFVFTYLLELSEEVKYKVGVYKSSSIGYTLTVFVHMILLVMDTNTLCF